MAIHDDTLDPTDIVMKAILDNSKVDLKESSTAVEGIPTKKERDELSYLNKIKQSLIGKSSKANPIVHKYYAELVGEPHPDGWDYPFTKGKTWFESDDWDADMQQYIPSINPLVVVNHNVMWTLLLAREFNRPSLLVGPPGSSKDTMAKYCHAICNVPEMSFTGHRMLDSDKLIGYYVPPIGDSKGNYHEFVVTRAVKAGATLRIEEPWALAPAVSYAVLQGLTDREPVLSLPDHPEPSQRRLVPDNRFRLVLTSNTTGQGEGLGTFVATEIQDSSTLNRITFRCKVDYMDPNKEVKIIEKAYPHINKDIGRKIIQFAGLLRKSHEQGILQEAFSPRNYLDWIAAAAACNNLSDGFKMTFYTIKNDREKAAIKEAWDYVKFAETL